MDFISRGSSESTHRLIVLTDMENEPDDAQTMVRLLMYSNEVEIEGLIAVTSRWLQGEVFPESIVDRINAYAVVRPNLLLHATGWPEPDGLLARVGSGQCGFGMDAVGDGQETSGSRLIISAVDRDDERPVWVAINAGANTLAQALYDVRRERSPEQVERFVSRLRVYDDAGQDNAGAWICHEFPQIFYIRSRKQVFGLYGPSFEGPAPWRPFNQFAWVETHIRTRHGLLGAMYPQRVWVEPPWNAEGSPTEDELTVRAVKATMEGGGTTTWLGLVNKGLFDPEHIGWGGWGGRLETTRTDVPAGQSGVSELEAPYRPFTMFPQAIDESYPIEPGEHYQTVPVNGRKIPYDPRVFTPLWRWREDYTRDFQGRMDWCVKPYEEASHNPVAAFGGDRNRTVVRVTSRPGELITLDASDSFDPNGNDLTYLWEVYPEAGSYAGDVHVDSPNAPKTTLTVPADSAGTQMHVILRVRNTSPIVTMTSYRRIVIDVLPESE